MDETREMCGVRPPERRVKVVSVPESFVLDLFVTSGRHPEYVRVARFDLPDDLEVLSVRHCWENGTIDYLVSHPSFDPVPEGVPAPRAQPNGGLGYDVVRLAREQTQQSAG